MNPSQAYQIPIIHRELGAGATVHELLARNHDPAAILKACRLLAPRHAEATQIVEVLDFLSMGYGADGVREMGYGSAAILAAQAIREAGA